MCMALTFLCIVYEYELSFFKELMWNIQLYISDQIWFIKVKINSSHNKCTIVKVEKSSILIGGSYKDNKDWGLTFQL